MKKFTSQEIKEFVSKPLFDEKIILKKDPSYPKISIVTPSYNQGKFLERTILSVLNQNYPNLEYIIIDGGSTDESVEIIKKYERYLAYWVSKRDKGQADAIKKGFEKNTGEIMGWLNSDDTYNWGAIYKVISSFFKNPIIDILYGKMFYVDPNDNIIGKYLTVPFSFRGYLYEGAILKQPATFWKSGIYKLVEGIDIQYQFCMDYDLFIRMAKVGQVKRVNYFLTNFRIHNESKSLRISNVQKYEHKTISKKYNHGKNSEYILTIKFYFYKFRRFFCYIFQGDFLYLIESLKKRFINLLKVD